jgi:mannose-1-phosphate guanylyltransferase/mannose-6-phosphate isomerase
MAIIPVILAGGSGTRLWPAARETAPKQFQPLASPDSLLTETLARLRDDARFGPPLVCANVAHREMLTRELAAEGNALLLLEPEKRNTAPAIAAAAVVAAEHFGTEAMLAVMPSDHDVKDPRAFRDTLAAAALAASGGRLAIVGIAPTRPETGYGYIALGEAVGPARAVTRFVEKPDQAAANELLADPSYLWNAGLVVGTAATLLSEMNTHCPDIVSAARSAVSGATKSGGAIVLGPAFATAPSISLDYALLEKCRNVVAVRGDFAWADLGNWAALWNAGEADANGNVLSGSVQVRDSHGNYIRSDAGTVAALGLVNMLVIRSGDATLVAPLSRAQDVGKMAEDIANNDATQGRVHRPWGYMDILARGPGFLVKRLMVKEGGATSVQLHNHRAEHMTVVRGVAHMGIGDEVRVLNIGESIDIPLKCRHRIENRGPGELHMIEVWLGNTLREDDIVRFEDRYGRC